jgi:glutamate-1-semialdehyde aminotransferase
VRSAGFFFYSLPNNGESEVITDMEAFDVVAAIQEIEAIRRQKRELEAKENQLKEKLRRLLEAVGGRLVVGGYSISLGIAETHQYSKMVEAIKQRHPQLAAEIAELAEQFKTVYHRIDISRV